MRKHFLIIAIVLAFAALATLFMLVRPATAPIALMRVCPEAWYDNQMPGSGAESDPLSRQYFIIDGKNYEYEQVDVAWVKENCEIKEPTIVY